jgi:uncharacterized membrane protein YczE
MGVFEMFFHVCMVVAWAIVIFLIVRLLQILLQMVKGLFSEKEENEKKKYKKEILCAVGMIILYIGIGLYAFFLVLY